MATSESSILASLLKQPIYAQRLAAQATSTDPTPSVGAGIARALMGGIAGLTESGDKARRMADFDAEYGTAPSAPPSPMAGALMGGGQPAMQPQQAPQPNQRLATALSGPSAQPSPMAPAPMGPMDSFPNRSGYSQNDQIISAVPQDEGPNQGVNIADIPPNAQPTMGQPTRMAQAPTPLPQQVPQNARQAPQIPADVMARARALAASDDPAGQARAAALLEPYKTPKDQERPMTDEERRLWKVPEGMSAGVNTGTGHPVFSPPQTNIALNTAQKGQEVMATESAQDFKAAQASGREAAKRSQVWDQMESASKGFKPGATAELKLQAKRYLKDLGVIAGEDVPDAEVFRQMQQQLAIHAQPKGQGAVSNFERDMYAKSIANMNMSPEALSRAIDMGRKLDSFDRQVAQIYRDNARKNGGVPDSISINEEIDKLGSPLSTSELNYLRKNSESAASPQTAPQSNGWQDIGSGVKIRKVQ